MGRLWRQAIALYRRPGVAAACLALQDRYGADVNLLLVACCLGASGQGQVRARDLRRILPRLGRWQGRVMGPLRASRRALKDRLWGEDPATQALRRRLLALELAAERLAFGWLVGALKGPRGASPAGALADAALSLRRCCAPGRSPPRGAGRWLTVLLAGAFPGTPRRAVLAALATPR